ncbi:MAG: serine hydrolase [Phycisphaerales bacterium]|nr:serine hydrolase [Phycisphaerales bacterium]
MKTARRLLAVIAAAMCTFAAGPAATARAEPAALPARPGPAGAAPEAAPPHTAPGPDTVRVPGPGDAPQKLFKPNPARPEGVLGDQLDWAIARFNGQPSKGGVADVFSAEALKSLKAEDFDREMDRLRAEAGEMRLVHVDPVGQHGLIAVMRDSKARGWWALTLAGEAEPPHKIAGFTVEPIGLRAGRQPLASFKAFDDEIAALNYEHTLGVWAVSPEFKLTPIHEHRTGERFNIGNAAMLFVLGAAVERVELGQATWNDKVTVKDELRSVPKNISDQLVTGLPTTLANLVIPMLAYTDNTAADHVIDFLGRGNIEKWIAEKHPASAAGLRPLLATREFFRIKLAADGDLVKRYAAADENTRRQMLDGEIARTTIDDTLYNGWAQPQYNDSVGWFAAASDIAGELARLYQYSLRPAQEAVRQALTGTEEVPFDRRIWRAAAYRTGGEPGVLAVWMLLERADGEMRLVVLAINSKAAAVDNEKVFPMFFRLLELLSRSEIPQAR